ncbi:hypothetical protein [Bacillus atrophaeus]
MAVMAYTLQFGREPMSYYMPLLADT